MSDASDDINDALAIGNDSLTATAAIQYRAERDAAERLRGKKTKGAQKSNGEDAAPPYEPPGEAIENSEA